MIKKYALSVTILILSVSLIIISSSCNKSSEYKQQTLSTQAKVGDKVSCPVLGRKFTINQNSIYYTYNEKKYYVCCPECLNKLKENPEKYLDM